MDTVVQLLGGKETLNGYSCSVIRWERNDLMDTVVQLLSGKGTILMDTEVLCGKEL